jgi:hypothetical protein
MTPESYSPGQVAHGHLDEVFASRTQKRRYDGARAEANASQYALADSKWRWNPKGARSAS